MTNPTDRSLPSAVGAGQILSIVDRGMLLMAAMLAMLGWCVMASRIMSDTHPIWDLASHLSWHTWIATSFVLMAAVFSMRVSKGEKLMRWWHRFIMALPPWLYLTWVTTPWAMLPLATNDSDVKGLKILSWNIWVMNQTPEEVVKVAQDYDADVVVLIEVGSEQASVLKQLESIYPFSYWIPDSSSRGIAVLSRVAGTRFGAIDLANEGMPAIEVTIPETDAHASYRLMAVHTRSPDLHQRTLDRNKQLHALAEWATLQTNAAIIIGDLNITPWSPPFSRLLERGDLKDTRNYRGHFASWPKDLGFLAIPIDHAIVSKNTSVLYRGVGPLAPDSDHRPIILTVK